VSRCTLEFGAETIVVAAGGTLEAEYALFDPGDIELSATGPGTIREIGYRTTAAEARARLAQAGLTRELAKDACAAARPWMAKAYARGLAVRRIADRLDAGELFDGCTYDPGTGSYAGTWLDLPALAAALSAGDPTRCRAWSLALQGLHLAARLSEHGDGEVVILSTAELTATRRPGERTFRRIKLLGADALLEGLRSLPRGREPTQTHAGPGRRELVRYLRERSTRVPAAAARLAAMEAALGERERPTRGPLADDELWALEASLSMGETDGVSERLDALERRRGRLPGTAYLRARLALVTRTEDPRAIAERVAALSTSMDAFHELQLLAAQAWATAGDVRRAHAFARDLGDNGAASDALRIQAREVLDTTARATTAPEGGVPRIPKPPLAPSGTDLKVDLESERPRREAEGTPGWGWPSSQRAGMRPFDSLAPAFRVDGQSAPPPAGSVAPPAPTDAPSSEDVEALALPPGAQDQPPPHDERPRTPDQARLAFTFLARELGRELRIRHGVTLRSDVGGLELAQRYLYEALAGDRPENLEEDREVMRHGAFLSELLARRLGARWVDLEPADPSQWAMLVPSRAGSPRAARTWPIGRVLRFVALRYKERDLVSYLLELEAFAR